MVLVLVKVEIGTACLQQAAVEGHGLEKRPDVRLLRDLPVRGVSAVQCGKRTARKGPNDTLTHVEPPLCRECAKGFRVQVDKGKRSTKGSCLGCVCANRGVTVLAASSTFGLLSVSDFLEEASLVRDDYPVQ